MSSLDKALNKGVPNDIIIKIPYLDVIYISCNKERTVGILDDAVDKYNNRITAITGKSYKLFTTNAEVQIVTDMKTLTKYITIAPNYIRNLLAITLNINGINHIVDSNGYLENGIIYDEEKAYERVDLLRQIKTEHKLSRQFPILYKAYKEIEDLRNSLEELKKESLVSYYSAIKNMGITEADLEMINSSKNIKNFIDYTSDALELAINEREKIENEAMKDRIDARIFGFSSANRLELYLADAYITLAQNPNISISTKQKCCYYISAYMFENEKNLDDGRYIEKSIKPNSNSQETIRVTKRTIYEKFKQLLIENPELFNVNFDNHMFNEMTQDEVNALMASYMESLKLKWDIIPDTMEITIPSEQSSKDKYQTSKPKQRNKDYSELFYQKKQFFDTSEPLLRVMGKDTFDGYIGYIYPSGRVILDKFYEDSKTKKLAQDVAIYSMGIDDFYRLSQLSKSEIIRDRLCKRFYHRGDWQQRVLNEINGEVENDIYQKTKILRQLSEADKK